jgi:hypothetical protein
MLVYLFDQLAGWTRDIKIYTVPDCNRTSWSLIMLVNLLTVRTCTDRWLIAAVNDRRSR